MQTIHLTSGQVRARYGGVSDMTLWRWLKDADLAFPQPIFIGRRRYWLAAALDAFDSRQASRAAPVAAPKREAA